MKVLKVSAYFILAAWILWFFCSWMNLGFTNGVLANWNLFHLTLGW